MATNHEHESGDERNPSVGFDKSDLGARGILIFFLVLAVSPSRLNSCVIGYVCRHDEGSPKSMTRS